MSAGEFVPNPLPGPQGGLPVPEGEFDELAPSEALRTATGPVEVELSVPQLALKPLEDGGYIIPLSLCSQRVVVYGVLHLFLHDVGSNHGIIRTSRQYVYSSMKPPD